MSFYERILAREVSPTPDVPADWGPSSLFVILPVVIFALPVSEFFGFVKEWMHLTIVQWLQ
jgi:hypothetical protein